MEVPCRRIVVLAEDQALLRVGLTRILEASGYRRSSRRSTTRPSLAAALADDDIDVAVVDVRMPPSFTTEGLVAAIEARAARPGLPVLVLSQNVEPLYARDLLAERRGRGRLPAQGPGAPTSTSFVGGVRQVAGRRHRPRPRGRGGAGQRQPARRSPAGAAHPSRAGGADADGRGPLERRDRGPAARHREGRRQAHQQHLHQARPAAARPTTTAGSSPSSPGFESLKYADPSQTF